ncbi:alpha/beta hydrolase, partial [Streptomyces sp. SID5475]|nr:alpha/beta hydrolase [Streptomyces sp. SID5475]
MLGLAPRAPHRTVRYGPHPSQLIDYHLPDGTPGLRVTILHGGFWREAYDRTHLSPLAAALAREGCAVALAEYRRVGGGGGWPATFEDVSRIVVTAWGE